MKCITRLSNISAGLSLVFLFFGLFIGSLSGCSSVLDASDGRTIEKTIAEISAEVSLKGFENGLKNEETGPIDPGDRGQGESGLVSALPETPIDPPEVKTETRVEPMETRSSHTKHNMSSSKKTGPLRRLFGGRKRSRSMRITGPPLSSTRSRRCLVG